MKLHVVVALFLFKNTRKHCSFWANNLMKETCGKKLEASVGGAEDDSPSLLSSAHSSSLKGMGGRRRRAGLGSAGTGGWLGSGASPAGSRASALCLPCPLLKEARRGATRPLAFLALPFLMTFFLPPFASASAGFASDYRDWNFPGPIAASRSKGVEFRDPNNPA